jgi:thymidylate kinase
MLITILGPDGTGKTTLAKKLAEDISNLEYIYFGNNIKSRKYKYFGNFLYAQKSGKLNTLLKYFFIFINDFHYYYLARKKNIISDRCPIDKFISTIIKEDNYRNLFHKFTLKLFPNPTFVILLEGDSEIIFHRKEEISISILDKYMLLYRHYLIENNVDFYSIDTSVNGIEETLKIAKLEIQKRYDI